MRRLGRRLLRTPAYLWATLALAGLLVGLVMASSNPNLPATLTLREAQYTLLGAEGDSPRTVRLPHRWEGDATLLASEVRYSLPLPMSLTDILTQESAIGLYLPRVGARFQVWLNDRLVHEVGWTHAGYVDTSVKPHLVRLGGWMFEADMARNRLEVVVQGQPLRRSGLSAVLIGSYDTLAKRHALVHWWQVQASWMVAACAAFMGILGWLVWMQTHERSFGLLAAASLALAVRLGLTPLVEPPFPFEVWFYLHKLSFTLYCGFLYLFFWDVFDYRQGRIRSLVTMLLYVGPIWILLTVVTEQYDLYRIWTGIMAVVSVVALGLVIHRASWGMNPNQRLMVVVGVATLITGVRDFLVVQLNLPGDADLRWMTPGSFLLMFTLGWVVLRRNGEAMERIAQLNAELERKVAQREAELKAVFERLQSVESQRVLDAERRRLTRDMHDGLGSQLVQTLNLVRAGGAEVDAVTVARMLQHALEDLRLTLDSLEPMEGDLTTVLGTLRQRIEPALRAAGLQLVWDVDEVPPVHGLDEAKGVMHLFRCLQEVFANIVKHAKATEVVVRTGVHEGRVMLSVQDNGVGLPESTEPNGPLASTGGGRGIGHIKLRARELGAQVRFESAQPGTRVMLTFARQSMGDSTSLHRGAAT